jgi:hypothetical protein
MSGQTIKLPGQWQWNDNYESNLITYDWGAILLKNLSVSQPSGNRYTLNGMYLEFENNSGADVTPPTFSRASARSYYDGLLTDPNRDYLRVSVAATKLESSNLANYPEGNRITMIAQTEGVAGVHGKTFSDVASSRVYGGALVSQPVEDDDTQDVIFSRFYFTDPANQLIKQAGSQITLSWPVTFL